LTLPGFVHDAFSALHPIFVGGPVFAELGTELAEHGLRDVQGQTSTGASFPDGRSAVIERTPTRWVPSWTGLVSGTRGHSS
jgi:phytoene dehydrogenase-like protein